MQMRKMLAVVGALAFLGVNAEAAIIDFTADTAGAKANGYTPVGHPGVHLSDTVGSGLDIEDFGVQSHGQAIQVLDDTDGSILDIAFDFQLSSLSLDFGNDDPLFSILGDRAVLSAFQGAVAVGQTWLAMNRNDVMDQTISFSGVLFDHVTFAYTNSSFSPFTGGPGTNTGLIEVVDNIRYEPANAPVPEPGSLLLLGAGLAGLRYSRRRRQS
jgi:PEP-CTERM motif-containing protein